VTVVGVLVVAVGAWAASPLGRTPNRPAAAASESGISVIADTARAVGTRWGDPNATADAVYTTYEKAIAVIYQPSVAGASQLVSMAPDTPVWLVQLNGTFRVERPGPSPNSAMQPFQAPILLTIVTPDGGTPEYAMRATAYDLSSVGDVTQLLP
jgi:hypothetical protein